MIDVSPERYRNEREILPIMGNFIQEKHEGTVTFWVPVEPLPPSLFLIEHGKGTFFLAARKYSCYFFSIPTVPSTGKQVRFSVVPRPKREDALAVALIIVGLRPPRQLRWVARSFFSVSANESFISMGESKISLFA